MANKSRAEAGKALEAARVAKTVFKNSSSLSPLLRLLLLTDRPNFGDDNNGKGNNGDELFLIPQFPKDNSSCCSVVPKIGKRNYG